jgi:hypothetical protein
MEHLTYFDEVGLVIRPLVARIFYGVRTTVVLVRVLCMSALLTKYVMSSPAISEIVCSRGRKRRKNP